MKNIFLVDADDTILDFHASSKVSLIAAFEKSGIPWEERYADEFKILNDSLWEALERKELTRNELIVRRFPLYLERLGIKSVDGETFNQLYLHSLSTRPIYVDGAEAFLKKLCEAGKVYLVTNGTEWIQKSRFSLSGVLQYVEDYFISDCIGCNKPGAAYTEYVVTHIPNFEKERAVWIGDSLTADIKAANDARITSVWYNPRGNAVKEGYFPDYTARNFEEILAFLQIMS
ncbi:MAG: YjjG family noncanonical pyrimidine nucleotidase [Clostridia bacterium]|nr:YjjG family noncanonical pyrimidine nucleotidase [Clostridia bacterium]